MENKSVKQKQRRGEVKGRWKERGERGECRKRGGGGCSRCRGEGKQRPKQAVRALGAWYRGGQPPLSTPQPGEVSSAMQA